MAHTRPFPIWMATLSRDGAERSLPLLLPAPFGLGRSDVVVKSELADAIDRDWMVTGDYHELVGAGQPLSFDATSLVVEFPRSQEHEALTVRFDAVVARVPAGGVLALAPAIDVGGHGANEAAALAALEEAIRAWFVRGDRRGDPRGIAETQWWTGLRTERFDHTLTWLNFGERQKIVEERSRDQGRRLEACARRLPDGVAYEVEEARASLRRVLQQQHRNVLIVGPPGCGKTALIADEARGGAFPVGGAGSAAAEVWTTTAARLVNALTREGDWQHALDNLCREIARAGVWLHVAALADLFEVGRYFGNETSVGEALRPWLARGEIGLVAECTPEQKAALEARYPGVIDRFARVEMPRMDDDRIDRVVRRWVSSRAADTFEPGAPDEAIRLLRRFAPYSGYPGRVLGFLSGLLEEVRPPVFRADVVQRFVDESGIPRALVDKDVAVPWADVRSRLSDALFGQPTAVDALVDVVTAVKADVAPRGRPVASLLFLGPTGVGKTEAARVLAGELFGDRTRFVRFDMSEFATGAAVLRLTRSPDPLGEGLLTGAVRRQPFGVILLDEIEKAHPDLFDLLLQVLGEGRLTDARGRVVDFCSAVVVMTSNLGAEAALRARTGFSRREDSLSAELVDAVHKAFRPEFTNRIDRVVPFAPLGRDAILRVLDREVGALGRHPALVDRDVAIELSPRAREVLAERGTDPMRGARPLQRTLRDAVIGPLSALLDGHPEDVRRVRVDVGEDGNLALSRVGKPGSAAPVAPIEVPADILRVRRFAQRAVRGESFASWASTCREIERSAQIAARRGRFTDVDHRLRDPLTGMTEVFGAAVALEAVATAAVAGLREMPAASEAKALEARYDDAALALFDRVHPNGRYAFAGLWAPADEPVPLLVERALSTEVLAAECGLRWAARGVWWMADSTVASLPIDAPEPRGSLRWLGVEVWLTGPAACFLLTEWAGLFALPKGSGVERALGIVACATNPNPPGCCPSPLLAVALPKAMLGPPEEPWAYWKAPRPDDLVRKAAFEGTARAWSVSASAYLWRNAITYHLGRR